MSGSKIETRIPGHHREMPVCGLLVVNVSFSQKPGLTPGYDGVVFSGISVVSFRPRSREGNLIDVRDL